MDRQFVLREEEKDKRVEFMRSYEGSGGLRVISYGIMSNPLTSGPCPEGISVSEVREMLNDGWADPIQGCAADCPSR